MFNLDMESAKKAGSSDYITEGGVYSGVITSAVYKDAQNSQAKMFELGFKSSDGQQANYMSICYQGKTGQPIFGMDLINAILCAAQVRQTSVLTRQSPGGDEMCAPELEGKPIAFALQKELYTKNSGEDGFRFNILCAFNAQNMKTAKETADKTPAEAVNRFATIADKDSRKKGQQPSANVNTPTFAPNANQAAADGSDWDDSF